MEKTIARELNNYEHVCYMLDKCSPFNVIIYCQFEGQISPELISESLETVRQHHRYLWYHIDDSFDPPVFINDFSKIKLNVIKNSGEIDWLKYAEEEMNTSFDVKTAPLLHATLLCHKNNSQTIVLNISHIISDGVSTLHFIKDFVTTLDNLISRNKIESIFESNDLCPNFDIFPEINIKNISIDKEECFQISKEYFTVHERRSKVINVNLSLEDSFYITNRCKANNISVNSILAASLILALHDYIKEKYGIRHNFQIKSSSGVNLRTHFTKNICNEQLGVYSGFGYVYLTISENHDVVSIAKEYGLKLKQKITSGHPFFIAKKTVEKAYKMTLFELSQAHESKVPYAILTNLGKIGFDVLPKNLKINKVSFLTPMHRNWSNDCGFGACALTYADQIDLNFIYMEPAWEMLKANKVINRILHYLLT